MTEQLPAPTRRDSAQAKFSGLIFPPTDQRYRDDNYHLMLLAYEAVYRSTHGWIPMDAIRKWLDSAHFTEQRIDGALMRLRHARPGKGLYSPPYKANPVFGRLKPSLELVTERMPAAWLRKEPYHLLLLAFDYVWKTCFGSVPYEDIKQFVPRDLGDGGIEGALERLREEIAMEPLLTTSPENVPTLHHRSEIRQEHISKPTCEKPLLEVEMNNTDVKPAPQNDAPAISETEDRKDTASLRDIPDTPAQPKRPRQTRFHPYNRASGASTTAPKSRSARDQVAFPTPPTQPASFTPIQFVLPTGPAAAASTAPAWLTVPAFPFCRSPEHLEGLSRTILAGYIALKGHQEPGSEAAHIEALSTELALARRIADDIVNAALSERLGEELRERAAAWLVSLALTAGGEEQVRVGDVGRAVRRLRGLKGREMVGLWDEGVVGGLDWDVVVGVMEEIDAVKE